MEYTFKTSDRVDAEIIMDAKKNYCILWELTHNFRRKFSEVKEGEFLNGVEHVLELLEEEIIEFRDIEE